MTGVQTCALPISRGPGPQATGQEKLELYPESPSRFFYKLVDAQIDFVLIGEHATALVLHQGGRDMTAPRKP